MTTTSNWTGSAVAALFSIFTLTEAIAAGGGDTDVRDDEQPFATLAERVAQDGMLPVIVQLRVDDAFDPALLRRPDGIGADLSSRAVERRRARIAHVQQQVAARLANAGATAPTHHYQFLPFIATTADSATLAQLRAMPEVVNIQEDQLNFPELTQSRALIGANAANVAGWSGHGQAVAILDTGVDTSHPALAGNILHETAACFSGTTAWWAESTCRTDLPQCKDSSGRLLPNSACGIGSAEPCVGTNCNHGTHVAAIAAGAANSNSIGIARGAGIIPVQVFVMLDLFSTGQLTPGAYDSDIIAGLEHVLELSADYDIAAVNMSLGAGVLRTTAICDQTNQATKAAIDNLRAVGIPTVIAAGNSGSANGLARPACISSAVSVGATTKTDSLASFSNESPAMTLNAPGASIAAAIPGTGTATFSGTSMAAPHAAGAMAVLKEKAAALGLDMTVDHLVAALRQTGAAITSGRFRIPRIQIDAALASIQEPLPVQLIVDNHLHAASVTAVTGSFSTVDNISAYGGSALQADSAPAVNQARFTPDIPRAGLYQVAAIWPVLPGNGNAVEVAIHHSQGTHLETIDQTTGGGRWHDLGTFHFSPGQAGSVLFSDTAGSRLVADAVRFDAVGPAPLSMDTDGIVAGTVGQAYRAYLEADGGTLPYRWSATSLPPGLQLEATTGIIDGIPTQAGDYELSLVVTDAADNSLTGTASMYIAPAPSGIEEPEPTEPEPTEPEPTEPEPTEPEPTEPEPTEPEPPPGSDTVVFFDDFSSSDLSAWHQADPGTLEWVNDAGNGILRKKSNSRAWIEIGVELEDFDLRVFTRKVNRAGTNVNRYVLHDGERLGYGAFFSGVSNTIDIERHNGWHMTGIANKPSVPAGLRDGDWYTLRLRREGTTLTLEVFAGRVDPETATPLQSVSTTDAHYHTFTHFGIEGGHDFDTDDVLISAP